MIEAARAMRAAAALAERSRVTSWPNPNVGCIVLRDGAVVGRGWTQPGGRPHAEAVALAAAGEAARGATLVTTLEPCAHVSERGPACADLVVAAGVARVAVGVRDPDPRTDGGGIARLRAAGIAVDEGVAAEAAARSLEGWLTRRHLGRPHVTLKLALSLDGCLALADGSSQWITGPEARAHGHLQRARCGAILVGRGTWDADRPRLDVRLTGLEARSPSIAVLSGSHGDRSMQGEGGQPRSLFPVRTLSSPSAIADLDTDHLLVEGGAATAAAFLREDRVDRLLIYRAPILIGGGRTLGDIGLATLADAHDRWRHAESRRLGSDRLDVYDRVRG